MAEIVRKSGQIIFKTQPPVFIVLFMTFWGAGFIGVPLLALGSLLKSLDTLEVSCTKIEPKLADCQISKIPKLKNFPPSTETYKGIKGVRYLTETETKEDSEGDTYTVTYYYVIFRQVSGENKVKFDDRAQWVVSQIDQFLKSDQETLKQTNSRDLSTIVLPVIFIAIFPLVGFFVVSATVFYQSIDINNNLRQLVNTRIGIPFYRKTLSFSDIKGLAFIESADEDGDRSYRLEIHTNKDKEIYLWSTSNQEEANNLANEICRLTGFRLIEQRLPSAENS
jgi:hypothetical protein